MTIAMSSPVTGGAQSGFTAPSITIAPANNPGANGKMWYVTAVSGMPGVTTHSASDPFTITVWQPAIYKIADFVTSTVFRKPPKNTHKIIVKKGVTFNSTMPKDVFVISGEFAVPQGCENLDAPNVRAAISMFVGSCSQLSSGFGDTVVTNVQ